MKYLSVNYKNGLLSGTHLKSIERKLSHEVNSMQLAQEMLYTDDRASINLSSDLVMLEHVKKIIKQKSKLKPDYLIVIGIGGSNLGTIAIQEAVLGKLYNQLDPKLKILYADSVDSDSICDIISIIKKGKKVILNVVSKSGGTTETIANFEVLLNAIKKQKNWRDFVVVTTDKGSNLWELSIAEGFTHLEIPRKVGGRYSVFSPVGLFPLGMLGINLKELFMGASSIVNQSVKPKNNAIKLAAHLYYHYLKNEKNVNDLFLFSNDLESVGKWYRQLVGESIGKEYDKNCSRVNLGITPTVSIGSTDLHSMAQLYLGGPKDKFTMFVRVLKNDTDLHVPNFKKYDSLVPGIQGKSLDKIMKAIIDGTQIAFKKGDRPYVEILLPDKSAASIAQFLQLMMMTIMYLGALLNLNPFNQPNVEDYKMETKRLLGK